MTGKIAILGIALSMVMPVRAQDLSTEVYASEDELYEALTNLEISPERYQVLRDAIFEGVGSAQYHLLDEIPNLSHFLESEKALSTALQTEQLAPFKLRPESGRSSSGELRYRYRYDPDQVESAQYFGSARVSRGRITAYGVLHREQSGDERVINRYVQYRNPSGSIRDIRVGNFSRRLGMGTAFGHRGKLLDFARHIGDESLLFPDFSGYNGLYARLRTGRAQVQLLTSFNRDTDHSLSTVAGMLMHSFGSMNTGLIVGVNHLRNRHNDASLRDVKIALPVRYRYKGGYVSLETCVQTGHSQGWGGVQIEGRHRFRTAEMKFAGWSYADRYLDLSGGSKTGRSRRHIYLPDVDFELSDKRSGHAGGMVKSIVLMTDQMQLVNAVYYSAQHRDSADFQLLSGLIRQHQTGLTWRLDHLVKSRRRTVAGSVTGITSHRTRLEIRFTAGQTALRSYIAYNTSSDRSDHVSLFVRLDYNSQALGRLQVWSNLARFDARNGLVEYWYFYLRNEQSLTEGLLAAVKISRSYSRGATETHRTQLSLEVKAVW